MDNLIKLETIKLRNHLQTCLEALVPYWAERIEQEAWTPRRRRRRAAICKFQLDRAEHEGFADDDELATLLDRMAESRALELAS